MTERVKRAIDIFLDAINNGTLMKGTCAACAVSNLVAHGMGLKLTPSTLFEYDNVSGWAIAFTTDASGQSIWEENFKMPEVVQCVRATDFTLEELMAIEFAFERAAEISYIEYGNHSPQQVRADQIAGLKAVVEVMLTFDDCKESVEEVFTQKAELIPIIN